MGKFAFKKVRRQTRADLTCKKAFMELKALVKKGLSALHIDLTRNMQYDRLTKQIMKLILTPSSNCIDIGCFKGEILYEMIRLAPEGFHFAFEPMPPYYNQLKSRFNGNVKIFPYALSEGSGISNFKFVKNAPAYSGLKIRNYNIQNPDIEDIKVETTSLDEIIPETLPIHFIKLDVEGGELQVLRGAKNLIKKDKPVIVFESGISAIKNYTTQPEDIFEFLEIDLNFKISLLKDFIEKKLPLNREKFLEIYHSEKEYYFVAHPRIHQ